MSYFLLWLCSIAGSLQCVFLTIGILGSLIFLVFGLIGKFEGFEWNNAKNCDEESERNQAIAKKSFRWLIVTISFIFISVFIPSTTQSYIILGAGTAIEYAKESPEMQKLPDNLVGTLNIYLEKLMDIEKEKAASKEEKQKQ